jgi:hypothetical protein
VYIANAPKNIVSVPNINNTNIIQNPRPQVNFRVPALQPLFNPQISINVSGKDRKRKPINIMSKPYMNRNPNFI